MLCTRCRHPVGRVHHRRLPGQPFQSWENWRVSSRREKCASYLDGAVPEITKHFDDNFKEIRLQERTNQEKGARLLQRHPDNSGCLCFALTSTGHIQKGQRVWIDAQISPFQRCRAYRPICTQRSLRVLHPRCQERLGEVWRQKVPSKGLRK